MNRPTAKSPRSTLPAAHGGDMPDEFVAIARIVKPQGRKGEVAAEILTDFRERFPGLRTAYLESPNGAPAAVVIEAAWPHKGRIVLKLASVDSIDAAEKLRGLHVLIPRAEMAALPEGHYYLWQLIGCQVVTERECRVVGEVTEVEPTGGVDLLRVASPGRENEILIPLAGDICKQIDVQAKRIVIDPPEDLLDLNR
jgi:16S rRNA processing protein RimM